MVFRVIVFNDYGFGSEVFYGEVKWVKFNRVIIIIGKLINKDKIFNNIEGNEDIIKFERMGWGRYNGLVFVSYGDC